MHFSSVSSKVACVCPGGFALQAGEFLELNAKLPVALLAYFVCHRMRETRSSGSVEGVVSNHDPYSD
jgi:hypothetical protein